MKTAAASTLILVLACACCTGPRSEPPQPVSTPEPAPEAARHITSAGAFLALPSFEARVVGVRVLPLDWKRNRYPSASQNGFELTLKPLAPGKPLLVYTEAVTSVSWSWARELAALKPGTVHTFPCGYLRDARVVWTTHGPAGLRTCCELTLETDELRVVPAELPQVQR